MADLPIFDWAYAQRYLRQGRMVQRKSWTQGEYVFMGNPNCVKAPEPTLQQLHLDGIRGADTMRPCYWLRDSEGLLNAGWQPTMPEQLAEDWILKA